jgi:hypothetical protein
VKLDELVNDRESESQAGARGVPIADRVEGDIHRRPTVKDGQLDAMTASMAIVASAVASSPQPRPPSQALAITATTNSGGSAVCVTGRISALTTFAASTAAIVAAHARAASSRIGPSAFDLGWSPEADDTWLLSSQPPVAASGLPDGSLGV